MGKCSGVGLKKRWWSEVLYWPQETKWANYKGMPTHCPRLTRHLIASKALSGSSPSTWSLVTGRLSWMRRSKPLTAFTVGLLGFYECKRMPFSLTNAPAMFQRLMETCLGDLNLHWCIMYLDHIVIFSKDPVSHLKRLKAVIWKMEEAGVKTKTFKMWAIPEAVSLSGACHLCWRSSHWWRQDRGYQELAHTY